MNRMRENLVRLQVLQAKAFDAGLNMEIDTRETNTDHPWMGGHTKPESEQYVGVDCLHFHFYDWTDSFYTEEEKAEIYEKELKKVEEFVIKHTRMVKHGVEWSMITERPTTPDSWLCATVDCDQIWVDFVQGKRFLLSGGNWYEAAI